MPWIWTAIALNLASAVLLFAARSQRRWALNLACVCAFIGVWIEKGMGLIIPGFVPSTLHELVEYLPSLTEWKITAGIWAFGLMVLTVAVRIALPVLRGELLETGGVAEARVSSPPLPAPQAPVAARR